jgi:hypothetical protein
MYTDVTAVTEDHFIAFLRIGLQYLAILKIEILSLNKAHSFWQLTERQTSQMVFSSNSIPSPSSERTML